MECQLNRVNIPRMRAPLSRKPLGVGSSGQRSRPGTRVVTKRPARHVLERLAENRAG
jgi:hypothetical protein